MRVEDAGFSVASGVSQVRRAPRAAVALTAAASLMALGLGVTSASAVEPKVVVQGRTNSSTTLDVSWTEVKGADTYRVQYSTDDKMKKSVKSVADVAKGTDATLTGLDPDKTYFVQVTALDDKGAAVGDSTVVKASTTYPYPAPGDIYAKKVTKSSMVLSWKSVGDAPGYTVEVTQKSKKTTLTTTGTSVSLSKLKEGTSYAVKVHASGKNGEELSKDSPSQNFSTSEFDVAAPDDFAQGKQGSSSFDVSWDGVDGLPKDGGYVVEWSLATTFTKPSTTKTITSTKTTISKLRGNQTYYARAWAVDAKGKRISAKSDYITTKTIVGRGTLAGEVSGAPSGDLMAVAYDAKKNAAAQVAVSDGRYKLEVRPEAGPYTVQVLYVGPPPAYVSDEDDQDDEAAETDYTSPFARDKGTGWTISQGTKYTVNRGETTKVDDIKVSHGNYVRGTVKASKSAKTGIRDVDVTAISGADPTNAKAEREVIGMARTDADGQFIIAGLPDGPYWFRFHYVGGGKGYKTLSMHTSQKTFLDGDLKGDVGLDVVLKKS